MSEQLPTPIQGGDEKVTRQSGIDVARQELKNDPMYNQPVIQGSADIFTTRQTGIPLVAGEGALQADRPAAASVMASDRAISIDMEAGMPGHPGVVPGIPDLHSDHALPPGHVYQGSPEQTTRQEGMSAEQKEAQRQAAKAAAEAAGFIVSDQPIGKDVDAGYPGHPGVVPGNPAAIPDAEGNPAHVDPRTAPVMQGGAEEVKRNEGMIFKADVGEADPRNPDGGTVELGADQLPAIQKKPIVPVIIADHPAPAGTVSVHDPMANLAEQAKASTDSHPLNPNALPVVDEDDASSSDDDATKAAKSKKKAKS